MASRKDKGAASSVGRAGAADDIEQAQLSEFLRSNYIQHKVAISSVYDTLQLGDFKRAEGAKAASHRNTRKKSSASHSLVDDEPLLVGLRVDMSLAQFRTYHRYHQRYLQGKKYVFVAYQNARIVVAEDKMQNNLDLENVPEDEEQRSQGSHNTSMGSQDSFEQQMMDRQSRSKDTINLNHFMAAYLVPYLNAKSQVKHV